MEEAGDIDMESSIQKFCVSQFAIRVCSVDARLAVQSWNNHPIPGTMTLYWIKFCVIIGSNSYIIQLVMETQHVYPIKQ